MIVDLTLDRLRLPALENFDPAFGKKELSGGVSTENVCNDVMLPFSKQRPIILTENSTTKADATRGDVQADCRLEFSQAGLTFALGVPSCAGIKAEFIGGFSTSGTSSVSYTATSGAATKTVSAGQKVTLVATTALAWEEKELFQGGCVLASSFSIAGPTLAIGDIVKVMFTSDLTAVDGTTALGLSYNGTSFPVKASSGGSLVGLFAHEVVSGTFKYLQAYTTLELVFDGTNFVVVGNPVVLSSSDYTIYADGFKAVPPVDAVVLGDMRPATSNSVYGTFEQAYSYIRNQDVLSDIEGLFASAAPYDGYAYIIAKNNGTNPYLEISINGTMVLRSYAFNTIGIDVVSPFTVPFKKGDVLGVAGGSLESAYCRYYKLRDYTGR